MIRLLLAVPLLLLASCPRFIDERGGAPLAAPDLETAAIARGLVRDPRDTDPIGLFARDTDRLCVVPANDGYRVGVTVDYGDGINCNASGIATHSGSALRLELGRDGQCSFDARFDGDRIRLPGRLPDGCAALCASRASLAGLDVERLSESVSEAAAMRDVKGKLPCAAS